MKKKKTKMKNNLQTRNKPQEPNSFSRAVEIRSTSANDEKRSIDAVIATDEPVQMYDYRYGQIAEILRIDGAQYPSQVPLLDSHSRYSVKDVLGSTRDFRAEDGQPAKLVATNYYASDDDSNKAWQKARDGHLTDNSIGYRLVNFTMIDPGQTQTIKGRKYTAPKHQPLRVVTDWQIYENSVCPIGADSQAKNRSYDKEHKTMELSTKQRQHIISKGFENPDELTENQTRGLLADFSENKQNDQAERIDFEARAREEAAKAERERARLIRQMATAAVPVEMVQRCIDEGLTIDGAREVFYQHISTTAPIIGTPNINTGSRATTTKHLEAGLLMRSGFSDDFIVKQYGEQVAEHADHMRTMGMIELAQRCIALEGKAIPLGREEQIRTALSTASLGTVLGNIANKASLRSYQSADSTWQKWCSVGSVTDFKEHTRVRLTDVGELETINDNGEIPHGSLTEEKEKMSIDTYGKQLSISRKDWYNDDLGMFLKIAAGFGRKAANKIAALVYAHLEANGDMGDGVALFHADHSNLATSAALGADGLKKALLALRKQKDKDGDAINIQPKFCLIPPDLEATAKSLLESDILIATGAGSTAATSPNKNIYRGIVTPIVENRLSSTTTWFLVGDPSNVDTIEVAFLNGKQTPTIEKTSHDFDTLGMRFRVYIDAGVKALDWRGIVKATS